MNQRANTIQLYGVLLGFVALLLLVPASLPALDAQETTEEPVVAATPEATEAANEPTPELEVTEVVEPEATDEVAPEATEDIESEVEATAEATDVIEATPETTEVAAEATSEATEVIAEATEQVAEATPETTEFAVEVTAEATDVIEATPETTEVAAEATEQVIEATPEIVEEVIEPLLTADFETEPTDWIIGAGASITPSEGENQVLLMSPGTTFAPAEALGLSDYSLVGRVQFLTNDANLALAFGDYSLTLSLNRVSMSGANGLLAAADSLYELNTWYDYELRIEPTSATFYVADELVLDVSEAFVPASFSYSANGTLIMDDIIVTSYAPLVELVDGEITLDDVRDKIEPQLVEIFEILATEGEAEAFTRLRDRGMVLTEDERIAIVLRPAAGLVGQDVSRDVVALGGELLHVGRREVITLVPLANLIQLASLDTIHSLRTTSIGTSTGIAPANADTPAGNTVTYGYDALGIEDWHDANVTGNGVKIGVIDVDFQGSIAGADYRCLTQRGDPAGLAENGSGHGLNIVEFLCDIAPDAQVFTYTVLLDENVFFRNAIREARIEGVDILVIAMDIGADSSPGDGSSDTGETEDPYEELRLAREEGITIFASAGNNGTIYTNTVEADPNRLSRYVAVDIAPLQTVTITLLATDQDQVNYSWNDWNGSNGGSSLEDFRVTVNYNQPGGAEVFDPNRIDPLDAPANNFNVTNEGDCQRVDAGPTTCTVTITVENTDGDATSLFQLQVIPVQDRAIDLPVENQTEAVRITNVTGGTLVTTAGTLARPADSEDVIAVGAVCAFNTSTTNFELVSTSSIGPVYAENGNTPIIPGSSLTRDDVKPDIVSIGHGQTTRAPLLDGTACNSLWGSLDDIGGLSGTSSAVAHAAGMAALLKSNTSNSNMSFSFGGTSAPDNMQDYLQTRVVELPIMAPDGFDYIYGAGFSALGNPDFTVLPDNPSAILSSPPDLLDAECSSFLFVGQRIGADYIHPSLALDEADPGDCVILYPGEYMAPIYISGTNANGMYSYDIGAEQSVAASTIRVIGQVFNSGLNGGVFMNNVTSFRLEGLTIYGKTLRQGSNQQTPAALVINGGSEVVVNNSTLGNAVVDGIVYQGWTGGDATVVTVNGGADHEISENTFDGNTGGFVNDNSRNIQATFYPGIYASDTDDLSINLNAFTNQVVTGQDSGADTYSSIIGGTNSTMDIAANTFVDNVIYSAITATTTGSVTELRVVSNVFLSNATNVLATGPLVQNVGITNTRFVNNTVVNNSLRNPNHGAIIGLGARTGGAGIGGTATFDFFNNLVYKNSMPRSIIADLGSTTAIGTCNRIGGAVNDSVQHNWWSTNGAMQSCSTALNDGGNNNRLDNPFSTQQFAGQQAGVDLDDDTDPRYYGLIETSNGIDAGDTALFADYASVPFDDDADGQVRIPLNGLVDIGAYEFSKLEFGDVDRIYDPTNEGSATYIEDDGPFLIDLTDVISGGFGEISLSVNDGLDGDAEFPVNFGTQCGGSFTIENRGIIEAFGLRLRYCPPADFYTDTSLAPSPDDSFDADVNFAGDDRYSYTDNDEWPDFVDFTIRAIDEAGSVVYGQIRFPIDRATNPDNDPSLSAQIGDNTPDGDLFQVTGNVGRTLTVRLRPFVDFGNFSFSERSNAEFFDGSQDLYQQYQVEFPFTYSNISAPDGTIVTNITNNGDGTITLQLGDTVGQTTITYTARDATNSGVTNTITVNTVSRIPSETGIYDDSSFAWEYDGDWTPTTERDVINYTLHTTDTIGDTANFGFSGTGFELYLNDSRSTFDLFINIDSTDRRAVTNWTQIPNSSVFEATVSNATTVFMCSTQAINRNFVLDTGIIREPFSVTCNSFGYTDDGDSVYEDGEPLLPATEAIHLVEVVMAGGRGLGVDAFTVFNDTEANAVGPVPLPPGRHDVSILALRDAFGSDWVEDQNRTYSNGLAYILPGPVAGTTANNVVSFLVQGGPGFGLETSIETQLSEYLVCVTDIDTDDMTCQQYDYTPPTIRRSTKNVFRPFYGLTANLDSTYRVDVIPTSVPDRINFVIDSVVVFEPTDAPFGEIMGEVDDGDIGEIVFGGGELNNWSFETSVRGAQQGTLTSVNRSVIAAGPYVAFETSSAVDLVYWTFGSRRASEVVMICVDRWKGVGTSTTSIEDTTDTLNAHGNCIVANVKSGTYLEIAANGDESVGADPANLLLGNTTFIIDESAFREAWDNNGGTHTFEIFGLYDIASTFDALTAIDTNAPLEAGTYLENTFDVFDYFAFAADTYSEATINTSESARVTDYTGDFTFVSGRGAARDLSSNVMYTNTINNTVRFNFHGTGFAPYFRVDRAGDTVEICYALSTDVTDVEDVFNMGVCQVFNNENRRPSWGTPRPILGLPLDTYTATIRFLGDNADDVAPGTKAMWFDGVTIYAEDFSTLNTLALNERAEGSYENRVEQNQFIYYGDGWSSASGRRAARYSALNYDLNRGTYGLSVGFRVENANRIIYTRDLSTRHADLLACATNDANPYDRTCTIIDNTSTGNLIDITFVIDPSLPVNSTYNVTLTAIESGSYNFDAVTPVALTDALTAGRYDHNDPNIIFDNTNNAQWVSIRERNKAFGDYIAESQTEEAAFRFAFTGTGFGLDMRFDRDGGELLVCYDAAFNPATDSLATYDFEVSSTCFTYQNEFRLPGAGLRTIAGLPNATYAVLVKDVEDGNTVFGRNFPQERGTSIGQIVLDSIYIFDTTVPLVDASGTYPEIATNADGNRFLTLVSEGMWGNITGNIARLFSDQSYVTVVDSRGRQSNNSMGAVALLNLDLNSHPDVQVVIDVQSGSTAASDQLLACVDGLDGIVDYDGTDFFITDNNGPQNCVILDDLTNSATITLNENNLPLLGVGGAERVLSLQTLTNGRFQIDGFQVSYDVGAFAQGFYEDTVALGIFDTSASAGGNADWPQATNNAYSNDSAIVVTENNATITFDFEGSGFSLITAYGTWGGIMEVTIDGPVSFTEQVDTYAAQSYFGTAATFAGLPEGSYTVTITAVLDAGEQIVLDALEVYGTLQQLGSLYDDAQTSVDGTPLIAFGPTHAAWETQVGSQATQALFRTLHLAQTRGAVASFEIGANYNARGIVLYYEPNANTDPIEVCFRDATNPTTVHCADVDVSGASGRVSVDDTNVAGLVAGHYFVTIENMDFTDGLIVDAVQVLEDGLYAEGIYDAAYIDSDATGISGSFTRNGDLIELASGASITFAEVSGIGVSLLLDQASEDYTLCLSDVGANDCAVVDKTYTSNTSALTMMGLHDVVTTDERAFALQLTNNGTQPLQFSELHVLGDNDSLAISDTNRYENEAPQLRSLPFGSAVEDISKDGDASGGSQSLYTTQGATAYFEFVGETDTGFQYARELSAEYGTAEICVGQIGVQTQADVTDNCQIVQNDNFDAFRFSTFIDPDATCTDAGCWVTISNADGIAIALDFIRPMVATGITLTEGLYEDNDANLKNFRFLDGFGFQEEDTTDITGFNVATIADTGASGGTTRVYTQIVDDPDTGEINESIDNNNPIHGGMYFPMTGTGATIYFTQDTTADAVRICFTPYTQGVTGVEDAIADSCQVFDNQERLTRHTVGRRIVGLPLNDYLIVVQMLDDNYSPIGHIGSASPITMKIDAVEVHNDDYTSLTGLENGTRTETSFANRVANNRFIYFGDTWVTDTGDTDYSGADNDSAEQTGSTVVFRANNTDAMQLITQLNRAASDVRMCAMPVGGGTQHCQDFVLTAGRAEQNEIPFNFNAASGNYFVSIQSLTDDIMTVDAIVLDATEALTAGYYEETHTSLVYNTEYTNLIANGNMESNGGWFGFGAPSEEKQVGIRFEGRSGWLVEGDILEGIQSTTFDLSKAGVYYFVARIKVDAGAARFKLLDNPPPDPERSLGESNSIDEFTEITQSITNRQFVTIRQTIVIGSDNPDYERVALQILSDGTGSVFTVDDVSLNYGGQWNLVENRRYADGSYMESQTNTASMTFAFTGTGFEIGMPTNPSGGEVQICYDDDPTFDESNDQTEHCLTYQQQALRPAYNVARSVTGLANGTYYVIVRDVEDGRTVTSRTGADQPRDSRAPVGQIGIDYVRIYDNELPPVLMPGSYNEDATDDSGAPYAQLINENNWVIFSDNTARNASEGSFAGVVDSRGRLTTRDFAGQTILLNVDVPTTDGVTLITYFSSADRQNSEKVLICVGGAISGEITWDGAAYNLENSEDCVLRNTISEGAAFVSGDEIPALKSVGQHAVFITSLQPGKFSLDGYQLISGQALPPGLYDDSLPDNLLNFDTDTATEVDRVNRRCTAETTWCLDRGRGFGTTTVSTGTPDATLTFDIEGSGFSVYTGLGRGVDVRICYQKTPADGQTSWPATNETINGAGQPIWDNSTQNLASGGTWCDIVTTEIGVRWTELNGNRPAIRRGSNYGFAYYGLPFDRYSVEVRVVEPVAVRGSKLIIDAIGVFSDPGDLPILTEGFYDNTTPEISYEPAGTWEATADIRRGPPRGPFNLTEQTTEITGTIMQMRIQGNALTLYQSLGRQYSAYAQICLVVSNAVIHCTNEANTSASGIQEDDNPSFGLAVELATFSQSGRARAFFAPILFYGLGAGDHTIIIENLHHGTDLNIDAILVQE